MPINMGDRPKNVTLDGVRLIKDLKVVELKAELERRGLSKSGSKKDLIERLRSYVVFEKTKDKAKSAVPVTEEEVPNKWLHKEANLDNDFIREYFQSQQELYRQQIKARRDLLGEDKPTSSEGRDRQEQIEAGKGRRLIAAEDSGGTSFGGGKSRRSRKEDASPDSSEGQSTSKFGSSVGKGGESEVESSSDTSTGSIFSPSEITKKVLPLEESHQQRLYSPNKLQSR